MARLFIIGNGFDIAHGLHTHYADFKAFLQQKYPDTDTEWPTVPQSGMGHHGETLYDDEEVAGCWMWQFSEMCGDEWNELETALGHIDYNRMLEQNSEMFDREGDRDIRAEMENNEDLISEVAGAVPYISQWFAEWVGTINLDPARMVPILEPQFHDLIRPKEDLFLNFNYTRVLECIYAVPAENICHIHGVQGGELMFGHGEGVLFEGDYVGHYPGSEYGQEQIHEMLRKDTQGALEKHQAFFERLSTGLEAIFSFGFSFSGVDQVYLREICSQVDTSCITWYLHDYDKEKHQEYQAILRGCGFRGSFGCFSA